MSRLVLFALTIGLLKNEVKCGTLGKISKFEESLMPRARGTLPSNATQLNPKLSSLDEVLVNASGRTDRAEGKNSSRKGKFFPNIAFVAGVNVGDLAAASNTNLASVAKISEAKTPVFNPYIAAATFGPYSPVPTPNLVQQYVASMQLLLDQLHRQLDGGNVLRNTSVQQPGIIPYESPISKDIDYDTIDDRKRLNAKARLDRLMKMAKKAAEKRRKEQLEELEYDYEEEEVTRAPQRAHSKKKTHAKQAVPMTDEAEDNMNTTNTNTTNNNTYPYNPGYFGGYPQQIGNIGLTYGAPQNAYPSPPNNYGPPSNTYGPPSNTYGPPSNTYGPSSNTYGPPYNTYGTPSNTYGSPTYANAQWPSIVNGSPLYPNPLQPYGSYGTPQFTSVRDHPAFYEEFPFGVSLASSEPWQQYPPVSGNSQFARSRKFDSSTSSPPIPNRNGFVPI